MTAPTERPAAATSTAATDVLFVSSQGGHLAQVASLHGWWSELERVWVCPPTADVADRLADERVITSHHPTTRNLPNMLRNFRLAVTVLREVRPKVVISPGAGVAVPFFLVAWMLRIPTVFIEVYDRIDSPTMTGRLCGPFTSKRILQWDSQLVSYPDGHVVGPLL